MRKITSAFCALLVLFAPVFAFAQTTTHNEQSLYGQKTNLTKYNVGACVDNEGGQWQQISDGTWAPPDDVLNTCKTQGMYQSWTNNSQTNPWLRAGIDYSYPNYQTNTSNYSYGTNYPGTNGGYTDYNSWFNNCVIMQSIVALPQCQAFPSIGTMTSLSVNYNGGSNSGGGTNWTGVFLGALAGYALAKWL